MVWERVERDMNGLGLVGEQIVDVFHRRLTGMLEHLGCDRIGVVLVEEHRRLTGMLEHSG